MTVDSVNTLHPLPTPPSLPTLPLPTPPSKQEGSDVGMGGDVWEGVVGCLWGGSGSGGRGRGEGGEGGREEAEWGYVAQIKKKTSR